MFGTIVNALAIIIGSGVGLVLSQGISERFKESILHAVGISVVLIGIKNALISDAIMMVILSMIVGTVIGEGLAIENRLDMFGQFLEGKFAKNSSGDTQSFARGFVTASLVFCVGSMAIVGSLESGLTGSHQTLLAKSILDGVISIIFTSIMGLGVMFSSLAVFLYQGSITMAAIMMKNVLVPESIEQMSSVGGLLIIIIGLNTLKITTIRVGNMLPAIFIPLLCFMVQSIGQ